MNLAQRRHPPGASIVATHPAYAVATLRQVLVLFWRESPVLEGLKAVEAAVDPLVAQYPRWIFLSVIEGPAAKKPPPEAVRVGIERILQAHERALAGAPVVVEGQGFGAALARSVVSVISLSRRWAFPHAVFPTLAEAATWMARKCEVEESAQTIAAEISTLRDLAQG